MAQVLSSTTRRNHTGNFTTTLTLDTTTGRIYGHGRTREAAQAAGANTLAAYNALKGEPINRLNPTKCPFCGPSTLACGWGGHQS